MKKSREIRKRIKVKGGKINIVYTEDVEKDLRAKGIDIEKEVREGVRRALEDEPS